MSINSFARLHIETIRDQPIYRFPCVTTAPGGRGILRMEIPLLSARVSWLPEGLDGLYLASDLQALDSAEKPPEHRRLIGHVIAEQLAMMGEHGLLPAPERCGVCLGGDLYAVETLDQRGGLGEVRAIWRSFAERFAWVVGVAGNHDRLFGATAAPVEIPLANASLLDGELLEQGGMTFGGVCGVVGDPSRAWRRPREEQLRRLAAVMAARPELLLLHEPPRPQDMPRARGSRSIAEALRDHRGSLVVCGHRPWPEPLYEVDGAQWLNVEARVVLLSRQLQPVL